MAEDTTFLRITNKDIYAKLCDIQNQAQTTSSRVNVNRWIAGTALTGVFGLAGWIFALLAKL